MMMVHRNVMLRTRLDNCLFNYTTPQTLNIRERSDW